MVAAAARMMAAAAAQMIRDAAAQTIRDAAVVAATLRLLRAPMIMIKFA